MAPQPRTVYRITHKKWANTLKASGYEGRWNSNGTYILYSAESMSLACLENLAHRNNSGLNNMFEVMHISIPKELKIKTLKADKLPQDWNDLGEKGKVICRPMGDQWVKDNKTPILRVPSVIIPTEYNFLINCKHPDFKKIKITAHHPFLFDKRL